MNIPDISQIEIEGFKIGDKVYHIHYYYDWKRKICYDIDILAMKIHAIHITQNPIYFYGKPKSFLPHFSDVRRQPCVCFGNIFHTKEEAKNELMQRKLQKKDPYNTEILIPNYDFHGFKIGKELYFLKENFRHLPCDVCHGKKIVEGLINNKIYKNIQCPDCLGKGIKEYKYFTVKRRLLDSVCISLDGIRLSVGVIDHDSHDSFSLEECFLSEKDAIFECERMNKENKNLN